MSFYGGRSPGVFSAFASGADPAAQAQFVTQEAGDPNDSSAGDWSPNWNQPTANTVVTTPVGQVPYNIVNPQLVGLNPDGTPTYLAAGPAGLPDWVVPLAIAGGAAFIGLGALGFTLRKKKRSRR